MERLAIRSTDVGFLRQTPVLVLGYMLWLGLQSVVAFLSLIVCYIIIFYLSVEWGLLILATSLIGYCKAMLSDPCKGMLYVDKKRHKQIYEVVNEISRKINGPKIHDIYITHDFNVAATSKCNFTPFKRNILILGYPLLCALSYRGFVGCVAHELGHIKHKHASVSTMFMAIFSFWTNIHLGIFNIIYGIWLCKWLPALERAIAPLRRQQEIEADQFLIDTFGGDYSAACQIELLLKEEQHGDFIEKLFTQMRGDNWGQCDVATLIRDGMYPDLPESRDEKVIAKAMKTVPNVFDEHPSFAQRLEMVNCQYPMNYAKFDADALNKVTDTEDEFNEDVNAYFHGICVELANNTKMDSETALKWLNENPPSLDMDNDTRILAFAYLNNAGLKDQRIEFMKQCLEDDPNNVEIRAMVALENAKETPDEACRELEACIEQSPVLYQLDENNFLLQYYMDSGDVEKIHAFLDMKEGRMNNLQKEFERDLSENDNLIPVELPPDFLNELCDVLYNEYKLVERAYCVKRLIDEQTTFGVQFLVLEFSNSILQFSTKSSKDIVEELKQRLDDFKVIERKTKFCNSYLVPIPGALVYELKTYGK